MTEEGKGSRKMKVRLKVGSLTLRWGEYFGSGRVEHMSLPRPVIKGFWK